MGKQSFRTQHGSKRENRCTTMWGWKWKEKQAEEKKMILIFMKVAPWWANVFCVVPQPTSFMHCVSGDFHQIAQKSEYMGNLFTFPFSSYHIIHHISHIYFSASYVLEKSRKCFPLNFHTKTHITTRTLHTKRKKKTDKCDARKSLASTRKTRWEMDGKASANFYFSPSPEKQG